MLFDYGGKDSHFYSSVVPSHGLIAPKSAVWGINLRTVDNLLVIKCLNTPHACRIWATRHIFAVGQHISALGHKIVRKIGCIFAAGNET
jgi:hypothetical protein